MKQIEVIGFVFVFIFFTGCIFDKIETIENQNKEITSIISEHCKCDEVRMIDFKLVYFRVFYHFEIIGTDPLQKVNVLKSINDNLYKKIDNYEDIDLLTFDFINKNKHDKRKIRYGRIED